MFEMRSLGGKPELLAGAVADLLRLHVEVIVAGPNPFIDAAKEATASSRSRFRSGRQVKMPARVQPLPVTSDKQLSETTPPCVLRTT